MIPAKTPWLAAIAWIAVVMAYAWTSNRDYDDAVLAHHAQKTVTAVGRNKPEAFPANGAHPPETAKALFRPTTHGEKP